MSHYKIIASTGQNIGDRQEQQDRIAIFSAPKAAGYMMAVLADGLGGKSGGALAAELVIFTAKALFNEFIPGSDIISMLENIINESHTAIQLSGMAANKEPHSTIVLLVLTPQKKAFWAHAGDSRLYRFSGTSFMDRTRDHSYVEKLMTDGKITPVQARSHKLANILINVLGSMTTPPYITFGDYDGLKEHDSFLLCSDGIWNHFSEAELAVKVSTYSPRKASELIINQARERSQGHGDNCSLAIIKLIRVAKIKSPA